MDGESEPIMKDCSASLIFLTQAVMVNGKKEYFAERSADVEASVNRVAARGRVIGGSAS